MDLFFSLFIDAILTAGIYVVMAYGLSLVYGIMQIVNLAHAGLMMLGAFTTFELVNRFGIPSLIAVMIVPVIYFFVGMGIERFLIRQLSVDRRKGLPSLLLLTGLWLIIQNGGYLIWGADQYSIFSSLTCYTINIGVITIPVLRMILFVISIVTLILVSLFLNKTYLGTATRAVSQNVIACSLVGTNVNRTSMISFGIGAAFSAFGGGLLSLLYSFDPEFGGQFLLKSFAVIILGGLGNLSGTIIGAFVLAFAEVWGAYILGNGWQSAIAFSVMLIVLFLLPNGIIEAFKRKKEVIKNEE